MIALILAVLLYLPVAVVVTLASVIYYFNKYK